MPQTPEKITRFRDEFYFLSNMYLVPGGIRVFDEDDKKRTVYRSSEHLYVASKFVDPEIQDEIRNIKDPKMVKKRGKVLVNEGVELTYNPKEPHTKFPLMINALEKKFSVGSYMAQLLLATGDAELIEGNTWGDNFWGQSPEGNPEGKNYLGFLLEDRRAQLRESN